ncbi:helix-turn-helix domain-containing protein [Mucilaginibacter terrae]|uniref:DNA-binding XRE family transcriptional regulator n=1 Tax=Mucilaginibacter terrae TaxID=1955052 RepID=A0ABU3GPP7_9SPHI|nr:helix-turn-helix domain-containing protein [Mucilaginibacter terrae]MDT3401754.1 DNA-binding XRE family transcriptional regulator [Mucilaginibacter terrae]
MTPIQTARIVKEARLQKALTQKELAALAGISLRSLQRIEKGEVLPRAYTWRQLGFYVNLQAAQPLNSPVPEAAMNVSNFNLPRKWIMSVALLVVIILAFSAFVIQSPTFPETLFEMVNMFLVGSILYAVFLYRIWR